MEDERTRNETAKWLTKQHNSAKDTMKQEELKDNNVKWISLGCFVGILSTLTIPCQYVVIGYILHANNAPLWVWTVFSIYCLASWFCTFIGELIKNKLRALLHQRIEYEASQKITKFIDELKRHERFRI